ncbi:hypothetical protein Tco_0525887 [Tanacetum coccineum]
MPEMTQCFMTSCHLKERRHSVVRDNLTNKLTNEDIRNSESYKEYYAMTIGNFLPKTNARTRVFTRFPVALDYDSDDDISWKSSEDDQDEDTNEDDENAQDDNDDAKSRDDELKSQDDQDDGDEAQTESEDRWDDFIHPKLTTHDDETTHEEETNEDDTFDPIVHTLSHVSSSDDKDSDNKVEGVNVEGEKSDKDATYVEGQGNEADKDTNANLEGRDDVKADVVLPQVQVTQEIEDTHVTLTLVNPDGQQQTTSLVDILITAIAEPSFFAPTNRPLTLTPNFTQLQQPPILTPATTPSSTLLNLPNFVPGKKMKEIVDVAVQLKSDRIREEAQAENQQFLDSIDEGMKKVIKEQEAKTSHAVAANLSELELKKILIDKMEANKSINRSDIQRQLYKALVDAYEADKILLDTYGDTVTIKRPRDGADDDQEPSAGTDRGSKRRRSGKEPESTSAPREKTTTTAGKTTTGSKTHKQSASQSAPVEETMQSTDVFEAPAHQEFETGVHDEQPEEEVHPLPDWFQQPKRLPSPDHAWNKSVPADHESVQPWLSNLARRQDPRESFDELTDTTFDFSAFVMNRLNVTTLTPELLAGPTFELMKGTCKSLTKLEYFCEEVYKATTEKLDWINPEGRQYPHDLDDDILYKFKEGDFHRLRIQDIEDMLLLLVQAKLTNLNIEERLAFNASLRMFTRSIKFEKKRRLHTILRSQGFIYKNKDKKNRLMRIDELHKFSDGTLDDVRTALNDRLKGIRMEVSAQTFWVQRTKQMQEAMFRQLRKRLKTRRINAIIRRLGLRYSDPKIQPEPGGILPRISIVRVEVLRTSAVNSFTMKMEILLEPTSNKLMIGRSSGLKVTPTKPGGMTKHIVPHALFAILLCQLFFELYTKDTCPYAEEVIDGNIKVHVGGCNSNSTEEEQFRVNLVNNAIRNKVTAWSC